MTEQAGRRRAMEEAAAAHAAKVRRRVLAGGVVALLVAAAGVGAYVLFGGSELDRAVDHARGSTARVRFDVSGALGDSGASLSGEMSTTGDGARATGQGTLTAGGEARPTSMRVLDDQVWIEDGGRWQRHSSEETPWLPANLIGLLADTGRVRATGRESAAGRRTTHYEGRLPLSELMHRDVEGWLPIDAWIDDDGRIVLMRSETTDFRMELEILEWGVPVEVERPQQDDP